MTKLSRTGTDKSNESLWKSRYSNTAAIASKATALLRKAEKAKYYKGIAYAKLNIAVSGFLQSKNNVALENLSDALAWFQENPGETGYAKALYIKGNIYESFGGYEKALEYCLQSQKLSFETNDRETEAEASSQLGLIYTRLCNFTKALEYYRHGLKIREELEDENAIASSLNRIAMIMRLTKKYNESLEYYFQSLEIRRRNRQETSIPWTLLGIASTYEELGKYEEALKFYEEGIKGGDRRCSLQCIMGAGRIFSFLGHSEKAENRLKESLGMAQDLKAMALIGEAHSALAKHYESTGKVKEALNSYKLFQEVRESVQSEEAQSRFRNIEISHAIEKSEQEKEIYRLRHVELKSAYDLIEEKNKDITSSISYASRIQRAILPDPVEIKGLSSSSFILYIPKDIVSGDFYWFTRINRKLIIAAGDCTGHGVPGALMSMLGISFLEEIVNNREIIDSGLILDELSKEVQRALHQKGREENKDGMDISICVIDKKQNSVQYSGAHNNLYLVRNNELIEYKADRMPIGINETEAARFTRHEFPTFPGDIIYMYSDGYADQFGGLNNKKFRYSTLKTLFLEIHKQPMKEQKKRLEKEFYQWKGNSSQIDDVLIIGLRI
jgi:serine phosphatase RsbU (regulator of sigma subunit)